MKKEYLEPEIELLRLHLMEPVSTSIGDLPLESEPEDEWAP